MWPLIRPSSCFELISAHINENTLYLTHIVERTSMPVWHFVTVRHWKDRITAVPFPSEWSVSSDQKYTTLCPCLQPVKGSQPHGQSFTKLWCLFMKAAQQEAVNKSEIWETYWTGAAQNSHWIWYMQIYSSFSAHKGLNKPQRQLKHPHVTHLFRLLVLLFRSSLCQEHILCPPTTSLVLSSSPLVLPIY